MQTLTTVDFCILNFIHAHVSCRFLDFLMPKVTLLGSGGLVWILTAILMLFFPKYRKTGILVGVGLLGSLIIGNVLLKNLVARERPCWINETVHLLIPVPQDYSFPSGHTFSSFIAATIIMNFNKRTGIAAYVLASMIAFSRLYLYVHFPTDVLAGILLGVTIGWGICKGFDRFVHRVSNDSPQQ